MLKRAFRVIAIAAAVAAVQGGRPASAEPVNILGGLIEYSRQNQAYFNISLVDGWMRGDFGEEVSESWTPPYACFACTPGATLDPSVTESMPASDTAGVGGVLMFRDVEYYISSLSFTIDSDPVTLPASFDVVDSLAMSTIAQFVMHGLVQARTADGTSSIGLGLLGYGKAQVGVLGDSNWFLTTYRFENPAAVPEPGTLLLFATGALGAVSRFRRRRRET